MLTSENPILDFLLARCVFPAISPRGLNARAPADPNFWLQLRGGRRSLAGARPPPDVAAAGQRVQPAFACATYLHPVINPPPLCKFMLNDFTVFNASLQS